jgi:hypothetical protein
MKLIDSLQPPVTHIWVTLLDVFLHISSEKDIKDSLFRKMPEVILKKDRMHKDEIFFITFMLLYDFLRNLA